MKEYNVTVYDLWQDKEITVTVLAYSESMARNHVLTAGSAFRYIIRSATINQSDKVSFRYTTGVA